MSAVLRPLVAIGRSREDSGPLTLWGCFNLSLEFWKYVTNSSLKFGVYSRLLVSSHWLIYTVYEYIEHNDTCQTSSRAIYILVETASITHSRGDLGGVGTFWFWLSTCCMSQYLWASISELEGRRSVYTVYQFIFRVLKNLRNFIFFICDSNFLRFWKVSPSEQYQI